MSYKLRPYQEVGVGKFKEYLESPSVKKTVYVAPCAAGKSLLIAEAAKLVDTPVLVIQPSKELLEQNYEKYTSYGNEASIYSASMGQKKVGHVTFCTPKSIGGDIKKFIDIGVSTVLIDEAHMQTKVGSIVDGIVSNLCKANKKTKVIGFTATPVILKQTMFGSELKMLNRTRDSMFNEILDVIQIQDIYKDFWTPLNYEVYTQDETMLALNSNGSEFTEKSTEVYFFENDLQTKVVDKVKELKDRKLIVIFAPSIITAISLSDKIEGSAVFYSGMPKAEREANLRSIKLGTCKVAVNVNILAVGWDETKVDTIIATKATNSIAVYYQQLARGVRIAKPGEVKEDCLILDFSGNTSRFGKIEDLTFEQDPVHGWGMFSGNKLLTGYPINAEPKYKGQKQVDLEINEIWFGKHKGKKLREIPVDYFKWILNDSGWDFKGERMTALKRSMEKILNGVQENFATTS